MDKIARVGIDLAKKVFHVTAVDAEGGVWSASGFGERGFSPTWRGFRRAAWWRWRCAAAPITGGGLRFGTATRC